MMTGTPDWIVGQNVKARRKLGGLNQSDFGNLLALVDRRESRTWDKSTVSRLERGQVSIDFHLLVGLARLLSCSPRQLLNPPDGTTQIAVAGTTLSRRRWSWCLDFEGDDEPDSSE